MTPSNAHIAENAATAALSASDDELFNAPISFSFTDINLYNDLNYLRQNKTPIDVLNKRLKDYMGCSVVNLSNHTVPPECLQTLNYGLSFCPTPKAADNAALLEAIENFFRKLKLKVHFFQASENAPNASQLNTTDTAVDSSAAAVPPDALRRLNIRSNWTPDVQDTSLALFMSTVRKSLQLRADDHHDINNNITDAQRRAISDLQSNRDITIKKADKGNSIVILNTIDYLYEAQLQLSNRTFYEPQFTNLTSEHENKVNALVEDWHRADLIDNKVKYFLTARRCKTAKFYLLPKIHKKNIPGRPIVSAIGCPTENLSAFVDALLCPLVDSNPSFIRDTTDFINKISTVRLKENSIIFTCDVTSLYTRINHPLGLKCIAKKLRDTPDFSFPRNKLLQALKLVLTCNNFEFNGEQYLQVSGVSMGTKCAPTYANLVLGVIENDFLASYPQKPSCWFRFIDDIFGIWDYSLPELETFVSAFNNIDSDIQITLEHSYTEVAFLDTLVKKSHDHLVTDLYRKPTDTTNYLMQKSAHPPGCKKGAFSQFLRLRRNCTNVTDYDTHAERLTQAYISRGYDKDDLEQARDKVRQLLRADLLQTKQKESTDNALVCTLPFNLRNVDARKIITDNWFLLSESPHLENLFETPPVFGYSRPKNLKDTLCQAVVKYPPDSQNTRVAIESIFDSDPCNRRNCKWCCKIDSRKRIKSTTTQERHKKLLHEHTDCETCNIIYLITCKNCLKQYVGETKRAFRTRMSEHDRDVRYNKDTNVSRHFNKYKHDWTNSRFEIIEHLKGDPDAKSHFRLKRETYWIATLRTMSPAGINIMIGRQFFT